MIVFNQHDLTGLMMEEANHRFYNGLQLIVAATSGILRDVRDPRVRARFIALQDRVSLLGQINRLYAGPFGSQSISSVALERLCAMLAISYDRPETAIEITSECTLQCPAICRTLLLLTGELMTNALKHGDHRTRLSVRLSLSADTHSCCLDVDSNCAGDGTAHRPRIATALAEAAGGTLSATSEAGFFRARVVLPVQASGDRITGDP